MESWNEKKIAWVNLEENALKKINENVPK